MDKKLEELRKKLDKHYKTHAVIYSQELYLKTEIKNLEKQFIIEQKKTGLQFRLILFFIFVLTISFILTFF